METLALFGIVAPWGAAGLAPAWLSLVPARGRSLLALPIAMVAGNAAGALVPLLGGKDMFGFGISLLAALAAGALTCALAVRFGRLSAGVRP